MKHCRLCDRDLSEDEFFRKKNGKLLSYCKECHRKYVQLRKRRLKYEAMGLTLEDVAELKEQGVCECCGAETVVMIDHDHNTGKFRGVLCLLCNSGIGFLGDSIEGVEKALAYLRRVYA